MHVEGHAVQRDDAAEHDADVANRKQGILSLRELCGSHVVHPAAKLVAAWLKLRRAKPRRLSRFNMTPKPSVGALCVFPFRIPPFESAA